MVTSYGKLCADASKKLNIELQYDQQFYLWNINEKEVKTRTRTFIYLCSQLAFLTTAKRQKQSNCPLADEQIKKPVYTYNGKFIHS